MNVPGFIDVFFVNENEDTGEVWNTLGKLNIFDIEAFEMGDDGSITVTTKYNEYCIQVNGGYTEFCKRFEAEFKRFSQLIIPKN